MHGFVNIIPEGFGCARDKIHTYIFYLGVK